MDGSGKGEYSSTFNRHWVVLISCAEVPNTRGTLRAEARGKEDGGAEEGRPGESGGL